MIPCHCPQRHLVRLSEALPYSHVRKLLKHYHNLQNTNYKFTLVIPECGRVSTDANAVTGKTRATGIMVLTLRGGNGGLANVPAHHAKLPDVLVVRLPSPAWHACARRLSSPKNPRNASLVLCRSGDSEANHETELGKKRTAWNKGVPIREDVREKVSRAMQDKWQDPEYRSAVEDSLRGREAWNKGMSPSEATRKKMSDSKMNHSVSRETRRKMSESHKGKTVAESTGRKVSEKLRGVPKSREHREKIAASMRKRHAAIRVLNAVESVYDMEPSDDSNSLANVGKRQAQSAKRQATSQVLGEFKAELREYRALQDELSPWNEAFVNRHGCKPTMSDVERTGISWLVTRYKRYVLLRERLFTQTHLLRRKLDSATGNAVDMKQNANRKSVGEIAEHAARLQAAAQYRMDKASSDGSKSDAGAGENADRVAKMPTLTNINSTQANPRVKAALQKAFQYRQQKADDTKAAALEAAKKAADGGSGTA